MAETTITPVILCGGAGTRLWPVSRVSYPKQFSALMGQGSLFQQTVARFQSSGFARPLIVTGDQFRFIVVEQLAQNRVDPCAILVEPSARNTAPAILSAALWLAARDPDALLLVLPSDHVIPDNEAFRRTVMAGQAAAQSGRIVTFGITPTRPETGYGYLELDAPPVPDYPVALRSFVEKPQAATAQALLDGGQHLWNAGIFLASAKSLIAAFAAHAPDMLPDARAAVEDAVADLGLTRLAADPWNRLRDVSIDYAIMEHAQDLMAVPYAGRWSDLGGWEAVWLESGPDAAGNVTTGGAIAMECSGSLLRSDAATMAVVGIGLTDTIVVAMPDAVLVADKSRAQEVKAAVAALKAAGRIQATDFPRDHRPWGWFESLTLGPRFQVKRICVKPGGALSLQSHHHRAEHWIVVEGTARVTIADTVRLLSENESVYVPLGAIHRLENPGKVPVMLIEVQTGIYLGEDDILRYDDIYART